MLNDVHSLIHSKHYHHHHLPIRRTLQRSYRHSNWYRLSVPGTLRPPDSATASIIDAPFLIINNLIELTANRAEQSRSSQTNDIIDAVYVQCSVSTFVPEEPFVSVRKGKKKVDADQLPFWLAKNQSPIGLCIYNWVSFSLSLFLSTY